MTAASPLENRGETRHISRMQRSNRHLLFICAVILALSAALTACGRKGSPEPVPGSDFPRQYPTY